MHIFMYFLHLVPACHAYFSPHDIIVEKGQDSAIFWIPFLLLCNSFKQLPPALEP